MGVFSWITSDTKRSIPAWGSGRAPIPVYLLSPTGERYQETDYDGYGIFGGVDAYEMVAKWNAEHLKLIDWFKNADLEERRSLGIFLTVGSVYEDVETGQRWSVMFNFPCFEDWDIKVAPGNYGQPIGDGLPTPNALISAKRWRILDPVDVGLLKYPIKLVQSPDISYDAVAASEPCPNQGFFYDDEDEE